MPETHNAPTVDFFKCTFVYSILTYGHGKSINVSHVQSFRWVGVNIFHPSESNTEWPSRSQFSRLVVVGHRMCREPTQPAISQWRFLIFAHWCQWMAKLWAHSQRFYTFAVAGTQSTHVRIRHLPNIIILSCTTVLKSEQHNKGRSSSKEPHSKQTCFQSTVALSFSTHIKLD